MPTPPSLAAIAAHWAASYGVTPHFFGRRQAMVAPRVGDADYHALFVYGQGDAAVVQAPAVLSAEAQRLVAGREPEVLLAPGYWERALGDRLERLVGPAWLGYADAGDVHELTTEARGLRESDTPALAALAAAVGPTAWAHGGLVAGAPRLYGRFEGDTLVAAAGVEVWGQRLGHVGVVTDPAYRGRGFGGEAVALAMRAGLAEGLIMQYRTLEANGPALAIARRLGFQPFARTLAVRVVARVASDE